MSASHCNRHGATDTSQRDVVPAPGPAAEGGGGAARGGLEALLDVLPVGVFTVGPDQRVLRMNPEAARVTGVPAEAALGRACDEVFACSFCDGGSGCAAREARERGEVRRDAPVDVRRPDGTAVSLRIDAVPLGGGEVAVTLRDVTESEQRRRALRDRWVFHGMVGISDAFRSVVAQVRAVAPTDSTVLILGESGTGKELAARAIHAESARAAQPFVTVCCSAYAEGLLESELFGHARGAFTGADRERAGRFEVADGGTVFLDELGEVSARVQVKLLRVLQEREIERIGESRPRRVDVRVVAATHRDLLREVREGRFREDLFYRLNVFTLRIPALRERREDLPVLVETLLQRAALRTGKEVLSVAPEAMDVLLRHGWPGNVRELENVLEGAAVRSRDGVLRLEDMPTEVTGLRGEPAAPVERMRSALTRAAGSVTLAAGLLGVHRATLWRWMREAGLDRAQFRPR